MTTQATDPARAMLLLLADWVPRDAGRVLELAGPERSIAARIRLWNPQVQLITATSGDRLPSPDELNRVKVAHGPFDAVLLHPRPGPTDVPGFLRALTEALAPGGVLLLGYDGVDPAWMPSTDAISAAFAAAGLTPDRGIGLDGGTQVAVRAVRAADGLRRMSVRAMTLKPAAALNDKRILEPASFLATIPGVLTRSEIRRITPDTPAEARCGRVTVLQRNILTPQNLDLVRQMLRLGHLVVQEFDDHPSVWPSIAEGDHLTFRAVHAVQTSTDVLAEVLRPLNPDLAVFPNQIAAVPPARAPRDSGAVTIFFGALNRSRDIEPLLPVLTEAIAHFGDRLAFEIVFDRALFDALPTGRKNFTPLCPYPVYLERLRRSDIALLPLNDTEFNRCKSDLKFIECAVNEVAVLASPCVYAASIRDGETGWLFRSPDEFRQRFWRLIEDVPLRRTMAERARAHVLARRLQAQHFRRRYEWYASLLERKDELDAALFERVPALRPR